MNRLCVRIRSLIHKPPKYVLFGFAKGVCEGVGYTIDMLLKIGIELRLLSHVDLRRAPATVPQRPCKAALQHTKPHAGRAFNITFVPVDMKLHPAAPEFGRCGVAGIGCRCRDLVTLAMHRNAVRSVCQNVGRIAIVDDRGLLVAGPRCVAWEGIVNSNSLARSVAADLGGGVLVALDAPHDQSATRAFGVSEAFAIASFLVACAQLAVRVWQARWARVGLALPN